MKSAHIIALAFVIFYFVVGPIAQAWVRRRNGGLIVRIIAEATPNFYKLYRYIFPPPPPPMPEEGPYRTSGKVIENADVHPSASIVGAKIAPDDEGQWFIAKGQGEIKPFLTVPRDAPQTMVGKTLDSVGEVTGVERRPGETDLEYRNRLVDAPRARDIVPVWLRPTTFPTPPNHKPGKIVPGAVYKLFPPKKD